MNFEFKSVEELAQAGKKFGNFGLNQKVTLEQFEYEEGTYGPSLVVSFKVDEASYKRFINPVTKVWAKAGGEIQEGHAEYAENKKAHEQRLLLYVNQIVEAITDKATVQSALTNQPPQNVVEYFKLMERVVKSNPQWNAKPLDLFLQYQYTPRSGYTRTFLEIPKPDNLKNGNLVFVTAAQAGTFKEDREKGLVYTNEEGAVHPIKRTAFFLTQPYSKFTSTEAPEAQNSASNQFAPPTTGTTTPNAGSTPASGSNW